MTWPKLLYFYGALTLLFGAVLAGAVIALDPYDTGRFALFGEHGVPHFGQRLIDASLARNSQFDIAIIGNSTIQLIDPVRIGTEAHQAVSLAIPGTGPREQLSVGGWFVRHHLKPYALVIGLDPRWCAANHALELTHPFPFWLYGAGTRDYLVNMLQMQSLGGAGRKINLLLGRIKPAPADGYNDYEAGRTWDRAGFRARLTEEGEEGFLQATTPPYEFPALGLLKDFLATLPHDTKVVLVIPQQFQPAPDAQQSACGASFAALARQHPHTHMLDFLARSSLTAREEDYWDRSHYRARVAREMEEGINEKLQ
jgi:hypothetical protein